MAEDGDTYDRLAVLYLQKDQFSKCQTAAENALNKGQLKNELATKITLASCQFNLDRLTAARKTFVEVRREARQQEERNEERMGQSVDLLHRQANVDGARNSNAPADELAGNPERRHVHSASSKVSAGLSMSSETAGTRALPYRGRRPFGRSGARRVGRRQRHLPDRDRDRWPDGAIRLSSKKLANKTNLGELRRGDAVNVERSFRVGDEVRGDTYFPVTRLRPSP